MKRQDLVRLKSKASTVAARLKVLSHPQRLMILCVLANGEATVGEIEKACGASQSAVSQFLKAMRLEDLIESRREGQTIVYKIKSEDMVSLMKSLYDIYCR